MRDRRARLDGPGSASDVAFRLAPRLNAPGRLGDASEALFLLIGPTSAKHASTPRTATTSAPRRQEVQEVVLREARREQVEALAPQKPRGPGHRRSRLAPRRRRIVAAKLVDSYDRPPWSSPSTENGRGSARTHDFHMYAGLASASSLLTRYGGHVAAAGLSLRVEQLEYLSDALCLAYRPADWRPDPQRVTTADATVTLDGSTGVWLRKWPCWNRLVSSATPSRCS